jgi:predicted protein tyrosine phosphatase
MDFVIRSRGSIERDTPEQSSYIIISIRDPEKQEVTIRPEAGLRGVLYLAFHDADPASDMALPNDKSLMTIEHANQIWQFVQKWLGKIDAVVVHCEQGISRSPAVAAALCKHYGGDETYFFRQYRPNRFVYELMLRCRANADLPGQDEPLAQE